MVANDHIGGRTSCSCLAQCGCRRIGRGLGRFPGSVINPIEGVASRCRTVGLSPGHIVPAVRGGALCVRDVTAAVLFRDGGLFLARRAAGQSLAGAWELPGGKIEIGETPEQCLERELHEEFGISVRVGPPVGESVYSYEHGQFRLRAFLVEWLSGEMTPTVHDRVAWVSEDEIDDLPMAPADVPIIDDLRGCGSWLSIRD